MDFVKFLLAAKTAAERLPDGRATGDSTVARRRNPSSEACELYITYIIVIYFCWKSISRLRLKSPGKSSDSE